MAVQHHKFETGGFVLHRIPGDGASLYSAWFDATGKLLDCEQTRAKSGAVILHGRAVPKTARVVREFIETAGRVYVGK